MRASCIHAKCLLTLLVTWQLVMGSDGKSKLEVGTYPMRKIINMLQNMQKEIKREVEADQNTCDNALCTCESSEGQLQKVIDDSFAAIQEYAAQVKARIAEKDQLLQEVQEHKTNAQTATKDLSEATSLRDQEHRDFIAQNKDTKFIGNLKKLIPTIKKGTAPSSLLQTLGLAASRLHRFVRVNKYMSSYERETVIAFLDQGSGDQAAEMVNAPKSDAILGILKKINDDMKADLKEMQSVEEKSATAFKDLEAAKTKEIKASETAIIEKERRLDAVALSISEGSHALEDVKEEVKNVQKFKANMKAECAIKEKEMNGRAKIAALQHGLLPPLISEKGFSAVATNPQSKKHEIIRWADSHGIDHSKIQIDEFSHGDHTLRGLAAAKDIKKYETILHIPKHLIIHSSAMPAQEAACHQLWRIAGSAHYRQILNLVYEKHRGKDSQWYDVIKKLPTLDEFRQYYAYALHEQFSKEFQFIPIINDHHLWKKSNNALWMNASLFTPQCFSKFPSKDEFLWAECVISTRQFGFGRTQTGLVPLIDYVNAALEVGSEANTVYYDQAGSFVLTATKNIKAGEELLDQYRTDDTQADYFFDTWGVLPEPGHPSRNAMPKLSDKECSKAHGVIRKYLRKGKCEAPEVVCKLIALSELHCQHIEFEL